MSLFDTMVTEVYTVTNRPDLVADTQLAVRSATLKLHQVDFFAKDLMETGIEFLTPAYIQSLEYRDLFPFWRKLDYLRKYDAAGAAPGDFFQILSPSQVLDSYGVQKENIAYLAGVSLEIRSDTADTNMLIGYYRNPTLVPADYDSWIALDHPFAVVFEAARIVFSGIGLEERATRIERQSAEQVALLKQSNL